jgi:zinc transport system permease protein
MGTDLFSWLEPAFMQRALLALVFVSTASAMMGFFVVSFRMAFFADAISHSAFTGVALGVLLAVAPMWAVVVFGLVVAVGVLRLSRRADLATDTAIGVFLAFVVALGIVVVSARGGLSRSFAMILYGDVLSVSSGEVVLLGGLLVVVAVFMALAFNRLLLISVHPPLATAKGIRVGLWEVLFGMLVALVVLLSLRAVGLLLVTALMVVPAAAARNVARSAGGAMWWSLAFAAFSAVCGLWLSYVFDSAAGATVVLVSTGLFVLSLFGRLLRTRV